SSLHDALPISAPGYQVMDEHAKYQIVILRIKITHHTSYGFEIIAIHQPGRRRYGAFCIDFFKYGIPRNMRIDPVSIIQKTTLDHFFRTEIIHLTGSHYSGSVRNQDFV